MAGLWLRGNPALHLEPLHISIWSQTINWCVLDNPPPEMGRRLLKLYWKYLTILDSCNALGARLALWFRRVLVSALCWTSAGWFYYLTGTLLFPLSELLHSFVYFYFATRCSLSSLLLFSLSSGCDVDRVREKSVWIPSLSEFIQTFFSPNVRYFLDYGHLNSSYLW